MRSRRFSRSRRSQPSQPLKIAGNFAAIDFETADYGPDSACAVAIIRVCDGEICDRNNWLIRPPRRHFEFTHIHGIHWSDVADQPTFAQLWPAMQLQLSGLDFIAAHNASFDRKVLQACCAAAQVQAPTTPFTCTVKLARQVWQLHPTKLPNVCDFLQIPLQHHNAASDAEACARIILAARQQQIKR